MDRLHLGVEVRDFDLEHLGISLAVLEGTRTQFSKGALRMTLAELDSFLKALKRAGTIDVSTVGQSFYETRPQS